MTGFRAILAGALGLAVVYGAACRPSEKPRFTHNAHLSIAVCGEPGQADCLSCTSCHEGVRQPNGKTMPDKALCENCHASQPELVARATTREPDVRGVRANLVFSHTKHLALEQIRGQCVSCHPGVPEDGLAAPMFPDMQRCLTCHDDEFSRGVCTGCHQASNLGDLVPRTFLRHDASFMRRHGREANGNARVCNQCHAESFCLQCHDTSQTLPFSVRHADDFDRELQHPADFVTRHAIEARLSPARCVRCHAVSTCEACHIERGVSGTRVGALNPHPPGFTGSDTSSPNFHGRQARRDLLTCAGCHDRGPATNCIRCHKVGGPGGNPHPGGWRSARSPSDSMCRYCHEG